VAGPGRLSPVGPVGPAGPAVAAALGPVVARLVGLEDVGPTPVVACSGGVDSVALLALVVATGRTPTAVHVDHGLRPGSAGEADRVAAVAATLGVAARSVPVTVAPGPNLEARARTARYAALETVRRAIGADHVLVGHTADDQAETVVLNLLRGSAAAGLGAMAVHRDRIVRPLLGLRRADCTAVCAAIGLEPLEDPMNADPAFRRVTVRTEVLPYLSGIAGRDLVPVLARQAEVLRSESEYLDGLARAAWPPDPARPQADALARLPVVVARRAVRQWLGPPPPSFAEVTRILAVAGGEARATEVAGGRRVWRRGGLLHVTPQGTG
jgi:tRNA(Ile)-lysidine synthase